MTKILIRVLLSILSLIILLLIVLFSSRAINHKRNRINSSKGIEFYGFVEINGIEQYMQIRGKDKENPVILFIHGGPGFPITYLSTYHQRNLEEHFTLVNYDQRGCGRTYYENLDHDSTESPLNVEVLEEDLDAIVDYVLNELGKEKVIIMGQSWGTVLGMNYINKSPEKLQAYVGVGQVIDFDLGKIYSAEKALLTANETDKVVLKDSISAFSKTTSIEDIDIQNLENLILTSGKYLSSVKELSGLKQMWLGISSNTMNLNDIKWFLNAAKTEKIFELEEPLINHMYYNFDIYDLKSEYDIPVSFIQGSNDYITPTDMVQTYFESIESPQKELVIQQEGGHTPFLDDPEAFADIVIGLLR